jgi:hypothetical protein
LLEELELFCEPSQRFHFRLRFHRLNFHGALGFLDALVGQGLRHTDLG